MRETTRTSLPKERNSLTRFAVAACSSPKESDETNVHALEVPAGPDATGSRASTGPDGTVVLGEVGLAGEVRAIGQVDIRLGEVKKMGFSRCLVPDGNLNRIPDIDGIEVAGIKTVPEAIEKLF